MSLDALIFDVDGTLAETEELHRHTFNETFALFGLRKIWPDPDAGWVWSVPLYRALLKTTGGKERIAAYLRDYLDIDPTRHRDRIAAIHEVKTRRYGELVAEGALRLRPGIADLVGEARRAGLALALATTTSRANVVALCTSLFEMEASDLFPVIVAGEDVIAKKPAPDAYHLALERLGIPAGDAIAFEDSRNGLLAAKAAGLRCVVSPSVYSAGEDFSAADRVVASFDRLGGLAGLGD
jgi:HAD superfamily hydrolase (TIGR01509 family)